MAAMDRTKLSSAQFGKRGNRANGEKKAQFYVSFSIDEDDPLVEKLDTLATEKRMSIRSFIISTLRNL